MPSRDEDKPHDPQWLLWSRRLQAIAQDGLTYTRDGYDLGRYEQLRELAAEILAAHSTGTLEEAGDLLALETGPATLKVDVRAAVFREERILLVKEPGEGGWSLPGGWADVGESPSEAAVRETLEESPSPNVDTDEVRFFGDHELPELSITRVTPAQVSRFFEQHRDPGLPTYF